MSSGTLCPGAHGLSARCSRTEQEHHQHTCSNSGGTACSPPQRHVSSAAPRLSTWATCHSQQHPRPPLQGSRHCQLADPQERQGLARQVLGLTGFFRHFVWRFVLRVVYGKAVLRALRVACLVCWPSRGACLRSAFVAEAEVNLQSTKN
jgi:hypothetical protein